VNKGDPLPEYAPRYYPVTFSLRPGQGCFDLGPMRENPVVSRAYSPDSTGGSQACHRRVTGIRAGVDAVPAAVLPPQDRLHDPAPVGGNIRSALTRNGSK